MGRGSVAITGNSKVLLTAGKSSVRIIVLGTREVVVQWKRRALEEGNGSNGAIAD